MIALAITCNAVADWAGCKATRKSTQVYVLFYGGRCVKSHASAQATIALSSPEAEYYALVKSGSVALGMKAMYHDLGIQLQ